MDIEHYVTPMLSGALLAMMNDAQAVAQPVLEQMIAEAKQYSEDDVLMINMQYAHDLSASDYMVVLFALMIYIGDRDMFIRNVEQFAHRIWLQAGESTSLPIISDN